MVITKKDERKVVVTKGSLYGYTYEAIALEKAGKNMIPYIITPASKEKATFKHAGEEFIFVLRGKRSSSIKAKNISWEREMRFILTPVFPTADPVLVRRRPNCYQSCLIIRGFNR